MGTAFAQALAVNAPAGATVVFTAPASGASGTFNGGASSVSVTANASGVATAPAFTANGVGGAYTVIASVPGVAVSANIPLTNTGGQPASIAVSSGSGQVATVNTAFGLSLAAIVRDAGGNAVPNVTVAFSAPVTGASGKFASSGAASATSTTNAAGIAISPAFMANATAGGYAVSASVAGAASPATFNLTNISGVQVTVAASQTTAQFMVDGTTYSQAQTFTWIAGSVHILSVAAVQSFGALYGTNLSGGQFVFANWSDNGAASHAYTVPSSTAVVTANLQVQYRVVTTAGTGGTVSPAPGFYNGGPITITATPNPGYEFSGFSGTINSLSNPLQLNLNYPASETAQFNFKNAILQVSSSHSGSFAQGQRGAQYTITVSNALNASTTVGARLR